MTNSAFGTVSLINTTNTTTTVQEFDGVIDPSILPEVFRNTHFLTYNNNTGIVTKTLAANVGGGGVSIFSANTPQIKLGVDAGLNNQGSFSVAIGQEAGKESQGNQSVSIGFRAGFSQDRESVAIGRQAGGGDRPFLSFYEAGTNTPEMDQIMSSFRQGYSSVAIGNEAGGQIQGSDCIAIGRNSGKESQADNAIALGQLAGGTNQGAYSIAIGSGAGRTDQAQHSIVISAIRDDEPLNNLVEDSLVIKPIRERTDVSTVNADTESLDLQILGYNPTTGEVSRLSKEALKAFLDIV